MSKGAVENKEGQSPKAGHAPKAGAGEHKAPAEHKSQEKPSNSKGPSQVAGNCTSWGCKKESIRFNFCDEHFDHFKFGLIKKTGEPVSDYDKKFGHYVAHKAKRSSQKVA